MADKLRLMDCTSDELAGALHMIEGHDDGLERDEYLAWREVRDMVLRVVESNRELAAEDAAQQAIG